MKKTFATLSIAAVLGLLSSPALAESTVDLSTGDLIKASGDAVYEIADDGSRLVFQMQSVYESWYGTDFANVVTISDEQLSTIPLKRVKSFKPGSLVKSPSLARVYIVDSDLTLKWFDTEEEFLGLGHSFANIKDIPDAFFTSYTVDGPLFEQPTEQPPVEEPPVEEPPVEEPPVEFSVESRSFTAKSSDLGVIDVATTLPSTVEITYSIPGSAIPAKTQVSDEAQQSHTFTLSNLQPAAKYDYTLRFTNEDETLIIEESGTFVSYYEVYTSAHGTAPTNGTLRQADVEVGRYFMYNNSDEDRTITEMWLGFFAANNASDDVTKTVKVIDVTPGSPTENEVVSFKNLGSSTNIRGTGNIQKFTQLDIDLPAGNQRVYSVVITNLENMNAAKMDDSDFLTKLSKVVFGGEAPIQYVENNEVGTKIHEVVE